MTRFATVLILVIILVAYQNCSNAKFVQNITGLSGKGMGPAAVVGLDSTGGAPRTGITVPATPGGVADLTAAAAISECDALQAQSATLELVPPITSVLDRRGNVDFQSVNIDSFFGNRVNFGILGLAATSNIVAVDNNSGNLIVCGMDVLQIQNSNGNIVVVGGDVGDISNFNGNIKIVNGRVLGSQTGVTGSVIEVVSP